MKRKSAWVQIVFGMVVLLGGLFTYGMGVHQLAPVPRPDLIVAGTSLIGTLFLACGSCDLLVRKSRQEEIEERDERNVTISRSAMASAYQVTSIAVTVALFALIFTGYMNEVSCLVIIAALLVGQLTFPIRLWYLQKTM